MSKLRKQCLFCEAWLSPEDLKTHDCWSKVEESIKENPEQTDLS